MSRRIPPIGELVRRPITTGLVIAAIGTTLLSIDALTMSARAVGSEPWRLVTSALPHVGVLHLIFNAYWTLVLGGAIESRCGPAVTGALVLATAVASASLEHALFAGGVGLSGIGYGLFGFAWVAARKGAGFEDVIDASTTLAFVLWFVVCCVTTYTGTFEVGNAAHAGGWAVGMLAGLAWAEPRRRPMAVGATTAAVLACVALASAPVRAFVNVRGLARDLADEAYARVEDAPDEAVAGYDAAIARDGTVANWHYNRAVALQLLGRFAEADAGYAHALELDPMDPTYRDAVAGTHARRSNEALAELRYDDALRELRAAIAASPNHPFAARWREAIPPLEQARDE